MSSPVKVPYVTHNNGTKIQAIGLGTYTVSKTEEQIDFILLCWFKFNLLLDLLSNEYCIFSVFLLFNIIKYLTK